MARHFPLAIFLVWSAVTLPADATERCPMRVDSSADRLQELLADLAEVATALEQGQNAHT